MAAKEGAEPESRRGGARTPAWPSPAASWQVVWKGCPPELGPKTGAISEYAFIEHPLCLGSGDIVASVTDVNGRSSQRASSETPLGEEQNECPEEVMLDLRTEGRGEGREPENGTARANALGSHRTWTVAETVAMNKPVSFSSQSLIYPSFICEMGRIAEPVVTASPGGVCVCY